MKFKNIIIAILVFLTIALNAQVIKPRVAVLPVENSGDYQLEIVSDRVTSTSSLILKMLGKYELILTPDMIPSDITDYCATNSIDNIITGKTYYTDNGDTITVSMSVYTREEGKITLETIEKAESVFDVFDAAEKALYRLLEGFSGEHIGFGSIVFKNSGEDGEYRVLIDGNEYRLSDSRIDKVLNGIREVEIYQDRMLGLYTVIKDKIEVGEGREIVFDFLVPGLLEVEKMEIDEQKEIIEKYWVKKKMSDKVDNAFARLNILLEDTAYSSTVQEKKEELFALEEEWHGQKLLLAEGDGKKEFITGVWLFPVGAGIAALNSDFGYVLQTGFLGSFEKEKSRNYYGLKLQTVFFGSDIYPVPFLAYARKNKTGKIIHQFGLHPPLFGIIFAEYSINIKNYYLSVSPTLDIDDYGIILAAGRYF